MSFAKAQLLLQLAMLATRSRGVSLAEIEEVFACSHRTAQRMSDALQASFPATEQRFDEDRRARWILPARVIAPLLTPSAEELAALSTAIAALDAQGMASEADTARQLERKVRALIPPGAGTRLAVDEEALLEALGHAVRPGPRPAVISTVDAAISEALKGPQLLRIVYRNRAEDVPSERIVAPHGLLLGVRRYLVARDTAKPNSRLRHYRVEEIYEAELMEEGFEIDPDFSIRKHAALAFGSYEDSRQYGEVVWKFTRDAAAHARRYIFHPTQQLEELEDGALIVRFRASGYLEMCWHLYSWGTAVEVLAPEALRAMVEHYRRSDFPALP